MSGRLDGKVALVTGGTRGIGLAVVRAFVAEGARVVFGDLRDEEGAAAATGIGDAATYVHHDVRDEAQWVRVIDTLLAEHGRLDVLVNNAGITGLEDAPPSPGDPEHVTLEQWRAVFATNLEGVLFGCKHAIRAMRPRGTGSIVNVSSRSGLVGIPGAAAYAASKAGVRNHTKTVALYCAEQGLAIRCNSVHPAAILDDPRMVMWIGRVDGQAVAAAMSYRTDSAVGVFGVTTVASARRRGYASVLTRASMQADTGLPSVLAPSEMAERMYKRLGYRRVGELRKWIRASPDR